MDVPVYSTRAIPDIAFMYGSTKPLPYSGVLINIDCEILYGGTFRNGDILHKGAFENCAMRLKPEDKAYFKKSEYFQWVNRSIRDEGYPNIMDGKVAPWANLITISDGEPVPIKTDDAVGYWIANITLKFDVIRTQFRVTGPTSLNILHICEIVFLKKLTFFNKIEMYPSIRGEDDINMLREVFQGMSEEERYAITHYAKSSE